MQLTPINIRIDDPHESQPDNDRKCKAQLLSLNYTVLAVSFVTLLTAWCGNRVVCEVGIPTDCDDLNAYEAYVDCTWLLNRCIVLASVCHIQRLWYDTSYQSKALWFLCFLAIGPMFSGLGEVPALQSSLKSYGERWDVPTIIYTCAFAGVLVLVMVQIRRTWALYGAVYPVSRLLLIAGYVTTLLAMSTMDNTVHVHHYEVGFLIACMACDASKLSQFFLCVGCGIMVHGISVYDYAPIVVPIRTANDSWVHDLLDQVANLTSKYIHD